MDLLLRYKRLLENPRYRIVIYPDGEISENLIVGSHALSLIPGSFNPLHEGHRKLYYWAKNKMKELYVYFELSITNIEKPPVSFEDLSKRIAQFAWYAPIIITNAPRFIDKTSLFDKYMKYHVGFDTARRVLEQYKREEVQYLGDFYVYDRGSTLDMLDATHNMARVPCNVNISSTELRKENK